MTATLTVPAEAELGSKAISRTPRPRARRVFLVGFALAFLAEAAWSYATPLLGAPDEPSQIVKAAAVVRGEWTAVCFAGPNLSCLTSARSANGFEALPTFYDMVRAPDTIDPHNSQICFHAHATVSAACARSLNRSPTALEVKEGISKYVWTYQARYPPLYYLVVGLPTLLGGGTWAIYLMRLVAAVISALFLGLAATVCIAWSTSRLLRLGLLVAVTPMVLFMGGVVNPSGLEIAAATACWCALIVLVTERDPATRRPLVLTAAGSAMVFEATRGLSPLWLALVLAATALVAAPGRIVELSRDALVRGAAVLVALVGVASIVWIFYEHATLLFTSASAALPAHTSTATILEQSFRHNVYYLPGMIGIFGWFDTRSPMFTFVIWYVAALVLIVAALWRSSMRRRIALVAVALAVLVVPVLLSSSQARAHGYVWSGRDTLPLAVGLPLLGAQLTELAGVVRSTTLRVRGGAAMALALFVASLGGFFWALRRWSVGTLGAQFSFIVHPGWQPATGLVAPLVVEAGTIALAYTLVLRAGREPPADAPLEARAPR